MGAVITDKKLATTVPCPAIRPRRLRQHPNLRKLIRESDISVSDLIQPLFIKAGLTKKKPIASMPGQFQLPLKSLEQEVRKIQQLNIPGVILFGIPEHKDAQGSSAWQDNGIIQQAIQIIKNQSPDLLIMADLCCCEYTDHGHCGVMQQNYRGKIDLANDATLELLTQQAISLAKAGADVIAPSGMVDGMVQAIRVALDSHGFTDIAILSYAVKYASSFYGPFRDAAEGAPQFGDRRSYQMDPANANEALREATLDVAQGTDMLMVKPAGNYLDVIYRIKQAFPQIPLGAYQVSGEYAMIKAAAQNGWLDEQQAMLESLLAIKRAGADFIISYFAMSCAKLLTSAGL
jgi:porphobilinogen synthase